VSAIEGFHHVTACVEGAQEDVDFCTRALGARLIKQTVLLDGERGVYHLYYADPEASVGNVLTSFPYKQRGIRGRRGSGQIKAFSLSVPRGSLEFWSERFDRLGVARGEAAERFGQNALPFSHPAGLGFELVEDDSDHRSPWTNEDIPVEQAIRGLRSVTLSLRETADTEAFMAELGFRVSGREGSFTRLEIAAGGPARTVDLEHEPDVPPGTWTYAAGTVHHVAFAVETEEQQLETKAHLEGLGYVDVSEIKNRNYFRSIYVRTPGGVLFEAATKGPGFAIDEPADALGQRLLLPEWYEDRREEILADLERIHAPAHTNGKELDR
jgi:glyoxalase family protein